MRRLSINEQGFSLIELIVALLIIGIIITVGIPRLNRVGATVMDNFLVRLNTLVLDAAQRAVSENTTYKVLINFKSRPPRIEIRPMQPAEKMVNSMEIPSTIQIDELYINRKVEPGRDEAWFFITPEGLSQEVIMNVIDRQAKESSPQLGDYGLVLNPFTRQFKLYDRFQRP